MNASTSTQRVDLDGRQSTVTVAQIFTLVLCALSFLVEGYDMQTMALVTPALAPEWHVKPSHFSLAISALNIGAVLGSALIAPFGDRHGRKRIIVFTMLAMGVSVAGTATASDVTMLAFWRFCAGLSLGAATINVTAFITEAYPLRRQALFLTIASTNLSLGGVIGGFAAAPMIHAWTWRSIFLLGGLAGVLVSGLLHFDLARDNVTARTANKTKERVSVFSLLSRSLAGVTISLWLIRFINAVVMFILLSWLPTMLKSIGWSLGEASRGSAMMQIGGIVGGVALSWLLDRGRATTALVTAFVSMIVIFLLFSQTPSTVLLWSILLVLGGGFSMGAHFALNALAATLYPQHMRATGAGWAGAMSRVGSIIGALVGGLFIHLGWGVAMTISLLSVPTAFSLLLTIALHFTQKRRASPKPILATEALQMP